MDTDSIDGLDGFLSSHAPIRESTVFSIGKLLGDWRITAFLSKGGSGEVYQVENVVGGNIAAAKVLVRQDEQSKDRFRREIRLLASCQSNALPHYHTSGEVDGCLYLIIELLERRELPHVEGDVARFLQRLCAGVDWLHQHGFVHRDIKPGNVLFRADGTPVLIDFGLAKQIEAAVADTREPVSIVDGRAVGVGTPRYAAPEQFNGGEIFPSTDIYALGMLANECFGGNPPLVWRGIIARSACSIPARRYRDVSAFVRAIRHRHYLRNAMFAGGVLLGIAAAAVGISLFLQSGFPAHVELNGQDRVIHDPIVLKGGRCYEIVGPGTMDADVSCPTDATLRLKDCVFLNRSRRPYPQNGVRYELEGGVYLNLIGLECEPVGIRRRDFIAPYDGAFDEVRFGGPSTMAGLRQLKNSEWYDRLRKERESGR